MATQLSSHHVDVVKALTSDPNIMIVELRMPQDGIMVEVQNKNQVALVEAIASNHSWIVTRSDDAKCIVALEPNPTSIVNVPLGTTVFHASDRHRRGSIISGGLKLGQGGNTSLHRSYPQRLHLAIDLASAVGFVNFQLKNHFYIAPEPESVQTLANVNLRSLETMDIFAVSAPVGTYHNDSHFAGRGIWTVGTVSPGDLRLLQRNEWVPLYHQLFDRGSFPQR